ncbi:39774_t:CDS:2, partial [Gigaspora margarita]
ENVEAGDFIHPDFTEELQKEWEKKGFGYNECKEWISVGLQPEEADLADYAARSGFKVEWLVNGDNLNGLDFLNYLKNRKNGEEDFSLKEIINYKASTEFYQQYQEAEEFNKVVFLTDDKTKLLSAAKTHPQAIYTSRLLDSKNLPQPQNNHSQEWQDSTLLCLQISSNQEAEFQSQIEAYFCFQSKVKTGRELLTSNPNELELEYEEREDATPSEKTKYELCKKVIIYKREKKLNTEQIAEKIKLSLAETDDILHYRTNYFTLERLMNYVGELFPILEDKSSSSLNLHMLEGTQEKTWEYDCDFLFNSLQIVKFTITDHYQKKHGNVIDNELICEMVNKLDGEDLDKLSTKNPMTNERTKSQNEQLRKETISAQTELEEITFTISQICYLPEEVRILFTQAIEYRGGKVTGIAISRDQLEENLIPQLEIIEEEKTFTISVPKNSLGIIRFLGSPGQFCLRTTQGIREIKKLSNKGKSKEIIDVSSSSKHTTVEDEDEVDYEIVELSEEAQAKCEELWQREQALNE